MNVVAAASPCLRVRYLAEPEIELRAHWLLREYERFSGAIRYPPVPVDEILETHLGLSLAIDDLEEVFGVPGILGATAIQSREVFIDSRLDPDNPFLIGRYRFTAAHEIGHWCMHRLVVERQRRRSYLGNVAPEFICREAVRGVRREPAEFQADKFAAHLLMPRLLVNSIWERMPTYEQYVERAGPIRIGEWEIDRRDFADLTNTQEMAILFQVSNQAMAIQLESLGLVRRGFSACFRPTSY